MIRTMPKKEKKMKSPKTTKAWMNTSITFPLVSTEDVSKEPLIMETECVETMSRIPATTSGFQDDDVRDLATAVECSRLKKALEESMW
nr:hypothetical protein [Tanacetum cinerariifolium]